MGAKIIIGTPGDVDSITIESDAKFTHSITNNMNGSKVDSQDVVLDIEGDITSGTSALIWTRMADLGALAEEFSYLPVRVYLDAETTARYEYLPEEAVIGPLVSNFRTVADDGAGYTHWKYGLTITITYPGNPDLGNSGDVYELSTSITELKANGVVIRKVWQASARAKTSAEALTAIMRYKPSEKYITEEIQRSPQEARAAATWVWERREETQDQSSKVLCYEETVEITGGGPSYEEDSQVGAADQDMPPPLLHLGARTKQVITLRGIVKGLSKDLVPPPPHWTENSTDMIRQRGLETRSYPVIEDWDRGIWKLEYMEVYWFIGGQAGDSIVPPNHHGHTSITEVEPPADGVMGNES